MSIIDDAVNSFNIGFFSTTLNAQNHMNFNNEDLTEPSDFEKRLNVVKTTALPEPPLETKYLDGFYQVDSKHAVPYQIPITGHFQKQFLDENGNWDQEAESLYYKEKEDAYKEEVISDWIKEMGYDLENKAILMKALLEKVG